MNKKPEISLSEGQLSINGQKIAIPKIDLIDIIGKGANAVVLKGHDNLLNRDVAIKIWLPRRGFIYPDKKRFICEIQKVSQIARPRIIRIFDANVIDDKYCYAILELVEGVTLRDWLLSPRDYSSRSLVARKIVRELIVLHKMKIFHGDLHDRNIMIKESEEILLLDFGTSIFCKKGDPHEREKRLLLETGKKILTEEEQYQFLDIDSLNRSPSECVPYALYALIQILDRFHNYEQTDDIEDNEEIAYNQTQLLICCSIWIAEVPFFNIQRFFEVFEQNGFKYAQLVYFFSNSYSGCESFLSSSDYWKPREGFDLSEKNLDNFIQLYSSCKKEFIIRAQNGTLDI
jgi:serine/threonine protein kinase